MNKLNTLALVALLAAPAVHAIGDNTPFEQVIREFKQCVEDTTTACEETFGVELINELKREHQRRTLEERVVKKAQEVLEARQKEAAVKASEPAVAAEAPTPEAAPAQ